MSLSAGWSLFSLAFLSATLLPGGSEAYLYYLMKNKNNVYMIILIATIGNTLGAFANYLIGRWAQHLLYHRFIGFTKRSIRKARFFFRKRGSYILFFAFLPIIGDPITAVAGVLEYSITRFFLWVFLGKMIRYIAIAVFFEWTI